MEPVLDAGEGRRHVVSARQLQDGGHVLVRLHLRQVVAQLEGQVLDDVRPLCLCNGEW